MRGENLLFEDGLRMNIQKMSVWGPVCLTLGLLAGFAGPAGAGTIVGSKHDFTNSGFTGGQICVVCHTPHNADISVTDAPLWNHTLSTQTYLLYSSPTLDAIPVQPSASSKLCLSCHDGTVAVDSFGGQPGGAFNLGGDVAVGAGPEGLSDDHPISFTYDTALASLDAGLHDPATTQVIIGEGDKTKGPDSIANLLLFNGTLQCASCHDVHNNFTALPAPGDNLLKVSLNGSQLCLTCHDK